MKLQINNQNGDPLSGKATRELETQNTSLQKSLQDLQRNSDIQMKEMKEQIRILTQDNIRMEAVLRDDHRY